MGGKAFGGRRVSLDEAASLSEKIESEINGLVAFYRLCGSARRQKDECGDLDIVVIPATGFHAWCATKFGVQKNGKPSTAGLIDGVQVEFYVAGEEDLGTQLMMWTGSMRENVRLRSKAKGRGWKMSQYGVRPADSKESLSSGMSEEQVYELLDAQYKSPEER